VRYLIPRFCPRPARGLRRDREASGGADRGLLLVHPAGWIATWFAVGLIPIAPGTWASLAALFLAWGIRAWWGLPTLALALVIVLIVGWWAADTVTKASDVSDPGAIVVDEVAGQWLVLCVAPLEPVPWALAFLLFRLFDVCKPWPVSWVDQRVEGGWGVMLDDIAAAGYASLVLAALLAIGGALGVRT
jgi:phosphatidylglycerophosphatase A